MLIKFWGTKTLVLINFIEKKVIFFFNFTHSFRKFYTILLLQCSLVLIVAQFRWFFFSFLNYLTFNLQCKCLRSICDLRQHIVSHLNIMSSTTIYVGTRGICCRSNAHIVAEIKTSPSIHCRLRQWVPKCAVYIVAPHCKTVKETIWVEI